MKCCCMSYHGQHPHFLLLLHYHSGRRNIDFACHCGEVIPINTTHYLLCRDVHGHFERVNWDEYFKEAPSPSRILYLPRSRVNTLHPIKRHVRTDSDSSYVCLGTHACILSLTWFV